MTARKRSRYVRPTARPPARKSPRRRISHRADGASFHSGSTGPPESFSVACETPLPRTVNRRRSVTAQRLQMSRAGITFMSGEAVLRIVLIELDHHLIARDFGNDRGRRDRKTYQVSLDDGFLVQPSSRIGFGIKNQLSRD